MKNITRATVQAPLKNAIRDEVKEWCIKNFGPQYNEELDQNVWCITSNYTREHNADFDVIFWDMNKAQWFILKWGGVLADVEYEETFAVRDEVFGSLFEVE